MGSDRARITYDESRQYRAVVMQQGRVTVEADWNEEEQIANEDMRKAALDFVGPNGTPDNGYRVIETFTSPPETSPLEAPFDFSVDKGTMYVGGVRAFSADPIQYSQQLDWLDYLHDPYWVDLSTLDNAPPQREFIYLYLREQEVSAVEDSALREVALGGPDTAQRLRLIQHIVRLETSASTCPTALAAAQTTWAAEGLSFDDQTMQLMSAATLKVSFTEGVTTPDPCEPQAHGGYLGADNQLIRVQVGFDQDTQTYTLVWGFDNASFLYRVTVADDLKTLHLLSSPVDDLHRPRANQAVEVLRSAAQLSATTDDYVASATGHVATLERAYAPDTQSITLPTPLPAEYKDASQTPVVFLRVWEEEKPFTLGTPVALGSTGIQVTIQTSGNEPPHFGDYWIFAARPDTAADPSASTRIFPHRYLEDGQPPDGPRLWACPLAVIEWTGGVLQTLADCRNLFDNLVKLNKKNLCACCDITVSPEDLTGTTTLQSIIDGLKNRDFVTICLTPSDTPYSLPAPLQLGREHSNLTLKSCNGGVTIQAMAGQEDKFLQGLIVLNQADNVTLSGLQFNLPLTPLAPAGGILSTIRTILRPFGGVFPHVSVGIRPVDCSGLTIRDCLFIFSTDSDPNIADSAITGYGILASGTVEGLTVKGNTFERLGPIQTPGGVPSRFFAGFNLNPTTQFTSRLSDTSITDTLPASAVVPAVLRDASFQDNLFRNLNVVAAISAQTIGRVKVVHNTAEDCLVGFSFDSATFNALAALVDEVFVPREQLALAQRLRASLLSTTQEPTRMLASVLARVYPLPPGVKPIHTIQVKKQKSSKSIDLGKNQIQLFFDNALSLLSEPLDAAAEKVKVKEGATTPPGGIGPLNALHLLLSAVERAALLPVPKGGFTPPPFSLYVTGNDIATIGLGPNFSFPAFEANHPIAEQDFDVIMSANKMQIAGAGLAATVDIRGGSCVITGNLILNSKPSADSVALILIPNLVSNQSNAVAITGNVFGGPILVPGRPGVQPPLDNWAILNTVPT